MAHKGSPVILAANVQDRLIYAAGNRLLNLQNQAVLEFKGRLNEKRLARAVRLSIDAEPILGSRFIEKINRSYWQRFGDPDSVEWLALEKTVDKQKAVYRFLTTPLNKNERQIKIRLIRSRENDTLCVKISHACCDGGGLKAYQQILAKIYTQLDHYEKNVLEANGGKRYDQNALLQNWGVINLIKAWVPGMGTLQPTWSFSFCPGEPEELQIAIRRLSGKNVEELSAYAQKRGVSMNDLLLTAFYRALFELTNSPPGKPREILITVDLRRYLQKVQATAVNNLSSAVAARIPRVIGEPFEKTLARVSAIMAEIKRKQPGMHVAAVFGLLSLLGYAQSLNVVTGIKKWMMQTGKSSPILSNVGNISPSTIWFGKIPVVDAYQVSPAIYAPGFMLGVCAYNNRLTLTVSYYKPGTPQEKVEQFLGMMLQELKSCK